MSARTGALGAVERALGLLAAAFGVAGGLALAVLAAVTVVAVFARYVLNDPIFGIEDVSQMALTVVVAGAVAYGARQGAHVSVDVIGLVAGRAVTRVTDALARLAGAAITGLAALALFEKADCGILCGDITGNLSIVHTPFYYTLSGAMACYSAILVLQLALGLLHWSAPNDPSEMAE